MYVFVGVPSRTLFAGGACAGALEELQDRPHHGHGQDLGEQGISFLRLRGGRGHRARYHSLPSKLEAARSLLASLEESTAFLFSTIFFFFTIVRFPAGAPRGYVDVGWTYIEGMVRDIPGTLWLEGVRIIS